MKSVGWKDATLHGPTESFFKAISQRQSLLRRDDRDPAPDVTSGSARGNLPLGDV
jgi:hypothetical protein